MNPPERFLRWLIRAVRGDQDPVVRRLQLHIRECRKGYISRGGFTLHWQEPCRHCNERVWQLTVLLEDETIDLQTRARIKDELEQAEQERANRRPSKTPQAKPTSSPNP